jgi:hypothetical protein
MVIREAIADTLMKITSEIGVICIRVFFDKRAIYQELTRQRQMLAFERKPAKLFPLFGD